MIIRPINFEAKSFNLILNSVYLFFSFGVWAGKSNTRSTKLMILSLLSVYCCYSYCDGRIISISTCSSTSLVHTSLQWLTILSLYLYVGLSSKASFIQVKATHLYHLHLTCQPLQTMNNHVFQLYCTFKFNYFRVL